MRRSGDLPVLGLPALSLVCFSVAFSVDRVPVLQILSEWLRKPVAQETIEMQERILLKGRRECLGHIWRKKAWCNVLEQECESLLSENISFNILIVSWINLFIPSITGNYLPRLVEMAELKFW